MSKIKRDNKQRLIKDWTADTINDELEKMDLNNYAQVIDWLLHIEWAKLKYMTEKGARIPVFIKCIAAKLVSDCEAGRGDMLNQCIDRVIGKAKQQADLTVSNATPELRIEVSNNLVENDLAKFVAEK